MDPSGEDPEAGASELCDSDEGNLTDGGGRILGLAPRGLGAEW